MFRGVFRGMFRGMFRWGPTSLPFYSPDAPKKQTPICVHNDMQRGHVLAQTQIAHVILISSPRHVEQQERKVNELEPRRHIWATCVGAPDSARQSATLQTKTKRKTEDSAYCRVTSAAVGQAPVCQPGHNNGIDHNDLKQTLPTRYGNCCATWRVLEGTLRYTSKMLCKHATTWLLARTNRLAPNHKIITSCNSSLENASNHHIMTTYGQHLRSHARNSCKATLAMTRPSDAYRLQPGRHAGGDPEPSGFLMLQVSHDNTRIFQQHPERKHSTRFSSTNINKSQSDWFHLSKDRACLAIVQCAAAHSRNPTTLRNLQLLDGPDARRARITNMFSPTHALAAQRQCPERPKMLHRHICQQ